MSSTTMSVGLDESGRNSSKVLKPPGGGTSDIFTSSIDETDKRMTQNGSQDSNGTATTNGVEKHGNRDGPTTVLHNNSGGDGINMDESPEMRKLQESKPAFIPASSMVRNCVTGEGCQTQEHYAIRVVPQREGNPVTGEGYDDPKAPQSAPTQSRTRIPPGGYSSGLW